MTSVNESLSCFVTEGQIYFDTSAISILYPFS